MSWIHLDLEPQSLLYLLEISEEIKLNKKRRSTFVLFLYHLYTLSCERIFSVK